MNESLPAPNLDCHQKLQKKIQHQNKKFESTDKVFEEWLHLDSKWMHISDSLLVSCPPIEVFFLKKSIQQYFKIIIILY